MSKEDLYIKNSRVEKHSKKKGKKRGPAEYDDHQAKRHQKINFKRYLNQLKSDQLEDDFDDFDDFEDEQDDYENK